MPAAVIDFFEYKFNRKIVIFENGRNRLTDYLELELAESLREDSERLINLDDERI